MSHQTTNGPAGARRLARLVAAAGLLAGAACSPTDVLDISDPDIINPGDVQSAAGADAVRNGALSRFNEATSGGEGLLLLGGLFSDEWVNGDSFVARWEIDRRDISRENTFLTTANRVLHRTRVAAGQAIELLEEFAPNAPAWQRAEMHMVAGYVTNLLAEHYCDGLVFSELAEGQEEYGFPITTDSAFKRALTHVDAGLALTFGNTPNDTRVLNALRLVRGRILMNLARPSDAAAAVAAVPTAFTYTTFHSQLAEKNNQFWNLNNNARRYSVGNNEGTNGLNFATAGDPRVPVCVGGPNCGPGGTNTRRDDLAQPFYVQLLWPTRDASVNIMRGIDARMIEAEAALHPGNAARNPANALTILNAARATAISPALAPLTLQGTTDAQVSQLFRERAFWQFGRGYRTGDLRRLVRQYGRGAETVFPTGPWQPGPKSGNYGPDVNMPVPFQETNNKNAPADPASGSTCINRAP
jgi:hypothetical protein